MRPCTGFFLAIWLFLGCGWAGAQPPRPPQDPAGLSSQLSPEDILNLHCLRQAYPGAIGELRQGQGGSLMLEVRGTDVPYQAEAAAPAWQVDIRQSMASAYPLEPGRPPTPPGRAPGRERCLALLGALYGQERGQVEAGLRRADFLGQTVTMRGEAAGPLEAVAASLASRRALLGKWLRSDGGYMWRRIAGEQRLSPHAFGIAIDLSASRAPYWRWSAQRPHPLQRDYPGEIVEAFESQGFIWGGKWHEYDIMHFEYRPELICKARLLESGESGIREAGAGDSEPGP